HPVFSPQFSPHSSRSGGRDEQRWDSTQTAEREEKVMGRTSRLSYAVAIGLMTGLVLVAYPDPAHAALGDVISGTPPGSQVTIDGKPQRRGPATAVALVQGSKISPGFPPLPVLVVKSCHTVNQDVLHLLDPTGFEQATIKTSLVPPGGWGALAVRAN